jgi:predicted NBD/HSP70 family sugar kinase
VIARVGRTVDELVRGVWVGAKVAAIGIVLPGAVDPAAGVVSTPANLPGWGDVRIGALLGVPRGVPVAMENDANAAAAGERWLGAAKGLDDFAFIALGTGIGAGVYVGGRLLRGAHHLAGEVAYFPMTREHLAHADWQHCLEGEVGGRAVSARAVELLGEHAKAADLFDAAEAGDERAREWLRQTTDYLSMATVSIAALLDPAMVVFGGGVIAAQGERLLGPVREAAARALPAPPRIVASSLGDDAQLLGAVRLALDVLEGA